jgi:hypothetical protein
LSFEYEYRLGDRGDGYLPMPILNIGLLTAVGTLVGPYVALGIGFYWMMQPTAFKNVGIAAYKPPSATVVIYPEKPFVPPTPSPAPPAVAAEPPVETAFAAAIPEVQEKPALAAPEHPKKRERTTYRRQERERTTYRRQEGPTSSRPEHFGRNTWGSPYEFRSVW